MAGFLKKVVNKFRDWKPKTIAGKILKPLSAVAGIGGLAAATVATAGAAVGAIGGGGILAGAGGAVATVVKTVGGGVKKVASKLSASAHNLVTGQNKDNRDLISKAKDQIRELNQDKKAVDKLIAMGYTEQQAMSAVGIKSTTVLDDLTVNSSDMSYLEKARNFLLPGQSDQTTVTSDTVNKSSVNPLVIAALGLGALLLFKKK